VLIYGMDPAKQVDLDAHWDGKRALMTKAYYYREEELLFQRQQKKEIAEREAPTRSDARGP
jgi:hypothetical protein